MSVRWDGSIVACCMDSENDTVIGELKNAVNVHQNKNRVYANLIVGNSNSKFRNRNKGNNGNNEYEHISIYNTYNNTDRHFKI